MKGVINMSGKPNRNRQHQVLVRLNQEEYEKLTRLVKKSGLSREEYLRSLINKKTVSGYSEEFIQTRLKTVITKSGDGLWQ